MYRRAARELHRLVKPLSPPGSGSIFLCGCGCFFFASRRRHTRSDRDWSSDVCSSDLDLLAQGKKVDYEGATGVTFTDVGEATGSFLEKEIKGGKFKNKKQR